MDNHGFMGFWSDIDAEYLLRYQQWHNCEHMPERVGIPGFIEGRRYRAMSDAPNFFMCYVTREPDVLSSAPYLAALNAPTPWTREALTHFRNPERSLYRRLRSVGSAPPHAPYIVLARFNAGGETAELWTDLEDWTPASADGPARVSLYDMDIGASAIMTAERRIYSAGPGEKRYLVAVETLERRQADTAADGLRALLAPDVRDLDVSTYWLEMRIRAADVLGNGAHNDGDPT